MNYGLLEDEIVARLAPLATAGHEVEAMPSIQARNTEIKHAGRITVQVGMAKFNQEDQSNQSTTTNQYEDVYVELIIRSKRLRTSAQGAGCYELSELARKLLMGWRSTMSWMPFECVDFSPLNPDNYDNSVWTYSLRMKTTAMVSPDLDEDLTPLIQQITILPDSVTGPLVPTAELFASDYSVNDSGDQVVLAWITDNAYEVEISGGGLGEVVAIGSATVTITGTTTFTLTATRGNQVVTATVEVTLGSSCADGTVENSDGTVTVTVGSGDTETFPDTPISANGDLVINQPSGVAIDIPVRYETLGTVSTSIVSGEIVVPDSSPTPTPTITKGLSFDGVNDYAVTGLPKIDLDQFSISFFFKMATTAGRTELYSFASLNTSGRPAQGMYYENNAFVFLSQDFYSFAQTLAWTGDTDSHHFVMRYDTTVNAVEIFIDGVSLGVCSSPVNYTVDLWSLVLGRAFAFTGYGSVVMTDVRVFNHYLTTAEIATLQTAGSPVGNEVLWYPFTESIGETDFCTDIVTGYQLALYKFASPFGVIAFTP